MGKWIKGKYLPTWKKIAGTNKLMSEPMTHKQYMSRRTPAEKRKMKAYAKKHKTKPRPQGFNFGMQVPSGFRMRF